MTQSSTAQAQGEGQIGKTVSDLDGRRERYVPGQGGWTGVDLASGPDSTGFFVGGFGASGWKSEAWLEHYARDHDRFRDVLFAPAAYLLFYRDSSQNSVFDFCFIQGQRLGDPTPSMLHLAGQEPVVEEGMKLYRHAFTALAGLLLGKTVKGVVLRGHLAEMFLEFTDGTTVAIGASRCENQPLLCCEPAVFQEGKR
jgi:hypothetical protein